jgi:REP element-mobilizing transposase RayT
VSYLSQRAIAGYSEVEDFLNHHGAQRPLRREHHLPREFYADTAHAFFLTLCARHRREPFRVPALAEAVVEALEHRRRRRLWVVYAYCLMPDHLHAVVQLSEFARASGKDVLQLVAGFKSFTTRSAWAAGLRGRLWQHDQYDRLLRNDREFTTRCRYVLDNPVRKGLVEDWTEWPYSGIPDEW